MPNNERIQISMMLYFLIVIMCLNQLIQATTQDYKPKKVGLSNLEWGHNLQDLTQKPQNNSQQILLRGKRFVALDNLEETANKQYQACLAPGEIRGHCRHLSNCILEEFRKNFARFLDYMCVIDRAYVGVCCPDNSQNSVGSNDGILNNFRGALPAIADEDEKPVWRAGNTSQNGTSTSDRQPKGLGGCGTTLKSRTRVVGGQLSDPKEWPWMVALIREDADHYCGGVLITDRHVLTAAHCFIKVRVKGIKVRLGEYDFFNTEETRAFDFQIEDVRIHEDFNRANYENDIAIIKLNRRTTFNTYIWPICLPPVGMSFEHKSAVIAGWGSQAYAGPVSNVLMEVSVPVWSEEQCSSTLLRKIPKTLMCAGAYEGGRDSCQGDSGGPLLHQLANDRWVVIGIVSWGIRCGEPARPGLYTRVSSYLDWIFTNAIF